jgi:hypothetical protein
LKTEDLLTKPLDLKKLYAGRYRIELDESAFCPGESKRNAWYFQIPCKHGHIYPCSDKLLGFYCTGPKIRVRLHADHPELKTPQWGDEEAVFLFLPAMLEIIAQYAKPRRKRQLSPERQKQLIEQGTDALKNLKNSTITAVSPAVTGRAQKIGITGWVDKNKAKNGPLNSRENEQR